MTKTEITELEALWYSADLEKYRSKNEFTVLSIHEHVINLEVRTWPHLLIVADPSVEKGPATIGLSKSDFSIFVNTLNYMEHGWHSPSGIVISNRGSATAIKRNKNKSLSFSPVRFKSLDNKKIDFSTETYLDILRKKNPGTASAVLLGSAGSDKYFREEIGKTFPELISSLLDLKENSFLSSCRKLIGLGRGFSPTGDDLICGALLAFHHFSFNEPFIDSVTKSFCRAGIKTAVMGKHMLEIGIRGLTPEIIKLFLISIKEGTPDPMILERLLRVGASTGMDIATAILCFTGKLHFKVP